MKTINQQISVRDAHDPFQRGEVILGDLTERQYKDLEHTARLSPGYEFRVLRYNGGPTSKATHVSVLLNETEVALVGLDCAQYYDKSLVTEQVVKRVSHRVYRKCVYFNHA